MSKVADVLKFRDRGLSVEDARKAMLAAGEAPSGKAMPRPVDDSPLEPEFEDNGEVVVAANPNAEAQAAEAAKLAEAPEPVVKPVAPAPAINEEKGERLETERFVAEIRQEKGKWVAEIQYKSGAGTEKFIATSKNELMLKLLEGKGHATLRVKEAVRREKLGGPKLDKAYALPEGITKEEFEKMTPQLQTFTIDTIAAQNAMVWMKQTPAYYATDANQEVLNQYMREHDLPYTVGNLTYAFEDLSENDMFPDKKGQAATPAAPAPKPSLAQPSAAARAEDSPAAARPAAPASPASRTDGQPAATVRKRGSTGLPVGHSSVPSDAGAASVEDNGQPKELSEAELKKLPLSELKRISDAERRARAQAR